MGRVAAIEIGVTLGARRSEPCYGLKSLLASDDALVARTVLLPLATCVASSDELTGRDLLCSDQFVARRTHV